jgi:gas vesicle protein
MGLDYSDKKLLVGLLVGAGLGVAAALLLTSPRGSRARDALFAGALDVADRVMPRRGNSTSWRDRRTERAGRALSNRVGRLRSAGL